MLLYAVGSLLFGFAMLFAAGVIVTGIMQYHAQMVAALRTLSLDGVHDRSRSVATPSSTDLTFRKAPVRPMLRPAA